MLKLALQIPIYESFEFLLVLEVLVGSDFDFGTGWFVANDNAVRMHLNGTNRPHVVDAFLDSMLEGTCLAVTVAKNENLTRRHNSSNTNSKRLFWHLVNVVVEETAISDDGIGIESLNSCL